MFQQINCTEFNELYILYIIFVHNKCIWVRKVCSVTKSKQVCHLEVVTEKCSRNWQTDSWRIVLLVKLIVTQPVKKFPTFYVTRRFMTVFTSVHLFSVS